MIRTLIIGYGNRMRGDDGVGPVIAETVAAWEIPDVRSLAVNQLVPELVDELKNAERVLFVDASEAPLAGPFTMAIVEPRSSHRSLGHHSDPGHLLGLTRDLEGRCPEAWMLAIGVGVFAYGERVSETAQGNVQAALAHLRKWLTETADEPRPSGSDRGKPAAAP